MGDVQQTEDKWAQVAVAVDDLVRVTFIEREQIRIRFSSDIRTVIAFRFWTNYAYRPE